MSSTKRGRCCPARRSLSAVPPSRGSRSRTATETTKFPALSPGVYTLTAGLSGFSDETVEGVAVADDPVEVPPLVLAIASFGDTVVVTASRTEVRVVDAPVTTSVVPAATLETTASTNVGEALRSVPGVNVIQLSARDVQVTSRQSTGPLANSQLVLMDGRSIFRFQFFSNIMNGAAPNLLLAGPCSSGSRARRSTSSSATRPSWGNGTC